MDKIFSWQSDFGRNFNHYFTMADPIVKAMQRAQREFMIKLLDLGGSALI